VRKGIDRSTTAQTFTGTICKKGVMNRVSICVGRIYRALGDSESLRTESFELGTHPLRACGDKGMLFSYSQKSDPTDGYEKHYTAEDQRIL